jgi:hypothetical protein
MAVPFHTGLDELVRKPLYGAGSASHRHYGADGPASALRMKEAAN